MTSWDRSAVARLLLDHLGEATVWAKILRVLATSDIPVSALYEMLAALPALHRASGKVASQVVFTTNYDNMVERVWEAAAEAVRDVLLRCERWCRWHGRIPASGTDGRVVAIERPDSLLRLKTEAHILVKLNGGLWPDGPVAERGRTDQRDAALIDVFALASCFFHQILPNVRQPVEPTKVPDL